MDVPRNNLFPHISYHNHDEISLRNIASTLHLPQLLVHATVLDVHQRELCRSFSDLALICSSNWVREGSFEPWLDGRLRGDS